MEEVVSNKERDIDKLEHEAEIYKEEIESLSALMGRMRKWVMSLRIAEEAPLENLLEHIREQQEREQTIWPPS